MPIQSARVNGIRVHQDQSVIPPAGDLENPFLPEVPHEGGHAHILSPSKTCLSRGPGPAGPNFASGVEQKRMISAQRQRADLQPGIEGHPRRHGRVAELVSLRLRCRAARPGRVPRRRARFFPRREPSCGTPRRRNLRPADPGRSERASGLERPRGCYARTARGCRRVLRLPR